MKRAQVAAVVAAVMGMVVSAAVWSRIPDPMPIHWNLHNQPDNFAPRWFGLTLMPGLALLLGFGLPLLLRIDPLHRGRANNESVMQTCILLLSAFLLAMHLLTIHACLSDGMQLSGRGVVAMMGLFFIGLGDRMPKVKRNYFMGFRTPWSLSSETVWQKTNRLGGWCMVVSGLIMLPACLLPAEAMMTVVLVAALGLVGLVPTVYSYFAWRAENELA